MKTKSSLIIEGLSKLDESVGYVGIVLNKPQLDEKEKDLVKYVEGINKKLNNLGLVMSVSAYEESEGKIAKGVDVRIHSKIDVERDRYYSHNCICSVNTARPGSGWEMGVRDIIQKTDYTGPKKKKSKVKISMNDAIKEIEAERDSIIKYYEDRVLALKNLEKIIKSIDLSRFDSEVVYSLGSGMKKVEPFHGWSESD